jgi:membrane protease YdiL (CAAX protease family)
VVTSLRRSEGIFAATAIPLLTLTPIAAAQSAPEASQPAPPPTGGPLAAFMLIGGILVLLYAAAILHRKGRAAIESLRNPQTASILERIPIPGPVLVLCGLAAWLVQPLGGAMALALAGTAPPSPDAHPLQSGVIGSIGAYGAAAVIIAGLVMVIPGARRAIGAALDPASVKPNETAPPHPDTILTMLRQSFVWSVGVGLAVYAVGAISLLLAQSIAKWLGEPGPGKIAHSTLTKLMEPAAEGAAGFLGHDVWWWGTVLGVTIGAPLVEEFIYRGFIQTGLLRITRSGPAAILATSLMFTLAHWSAVEGHALFTLFALSLGFGLALEKTGKLWVCILMHAAFNIGNIVMAMV